MHLGEEVLDGRVLFDGGSDVLDSLGEELKATHTATGRQQQKKGKKENTNA